MSNIQAFSLGLVVALGSALTVLPAAAPPQKVDADSLATGVDRTFARMRDLSADFVQISHDDLKPKQQESGHLYLMKGGKMRWEYQKPADKLFVTDGKTVYFFDPASRQVNKDQVKNIGDERLPLMFLLGRSGLRNEFNPIYLDPRKPAVDGTRVLRLIPKRKGAIRAIEIEVDPSRYLIRRLVVDKSEQGTDEFTFSNIVTDSNLPSSQFDFKVPPGVEVINGFGQ